MLGGVLEIDEKVEIWYIIGNGKCERRFKTDDKKVV